MVIMIDKVTLNYAAISKPKIERNLTNVLQIHNKLIEKTHHVILISSRTCIDNLFHHHTEWALNKITALFHHHLPSVHQVNAGRQLTIHQGISLNTEGAC